MVVRSHLKEAAMTQSFSVNIDTLDKGVVVHLAGDITLTHLDELHDALQQIIECHPTKVVLDLADLAFINSLGLGVLIEFRQGLAQCGGDLAMACASEHIADILRKTRLVELFPLHPDTKTALGD